MAQEANSCNPGSILGRDTSFDVPESSCLLSGPGLQLDSRYNRDTFSCEPTHSRLTTIIESMSMTFENLPIVWIISKYGANFTRSNTGRDPLPAVLCGNAIFRRYRMKPPVADLSRYSFLWSLSHAPLDLLELSTLFGRRPASFSKYSAKTNNYTLGPGR